MGDEDADFSLVTTRRDGVAKPKSKKYRFETFEGGAKFFLKGRVMLGVHYKQMATSMTLIFASWSCFLFVCFHLSRFERQIVAGFIFCSMQVFLLLGTSLREPGIVPRIPPSSSPSAYFSQLTLDDLSTLEFCKVCNIFKLPRTKHCRYCNSCISGFDHHCPWVGSCIGARNYSSFFLQNILSYLGAWT